MRSQYTSLEEVGKVFSRHSLFLDGLFGMSFKWVFHSNGIASKQLIRTKYSAPVKFLFCNVLHDFSLPSSDNMSRTVHEETFLENLVPEQRFSIYTHKLNIPNNFSLLARQVR